MSRGPGQQGGKARQTALVTMGISDTNHLKKADGFADASAGDCLPVPLPRENCAACGGVRETALGPGQIHWRRS